MSKPTETLKSAAGRYGDAKLRLDTWQGEPAGPAWARALGDYRRALIELTSAACGYATSTRPRRNIETEEATL